ncbi:hypothetical protein DMENIID0001_109980 [Sergentomyia squamirostris]
MTAEKRINRHDELCLMCAKTNEKVPDLFNLIKVIGAEICIACKIMQIKMNHQHGSIIRNTNPNGLIISDVRSQVAVADDHFTYSPSHEMEETSGGGDLGFGGISNLLRPIYMKVENFRDTESDGAIYSVSAPIQCDVCLKMFTRKSNMVRHMHNQHRARSRAGSARTEDPRRSAHKCQTCSEEFSERRTLNKHKMSHRKTFSCPNCQKAFYVRREMDWHEAECNGRVNAAKKSRKPVKRKGRLQSSVSLYVDTEDQNPDNTTKYPPVFRQDSLRQLTKTPTLSEKFQSIQKWCNSTSVEGPPVILQVENPAPAEDDTQSTISRFTSVSQKTINTCLSSRSSNFSRSMYTDYSFRSAQTIQTFRDEMLHLQSRRITRSVTRRIRKIDLELKVRTLLHRNMSKSTGGSRRHFDITRRAKFVRTSRRILLPDSLKCGCNFTMKNLREFMEHEIEVHKKLPLFRCSECNDCYTQKHFLEQHKECHSRIYSCIWCFTQFENALDLKIHLELHSLNAIKCGFCEANFISRRELRDHMKDIHSEEGLKMPRKAEILLRRGQKRELVEKAQKEYCTKDLIQPARKLERRSWIFEFYTRFKRVQLGTLVKEKSEDCEETGETDPILLPVCVDICRYSTPSPQISESHGSTKVTVTPPPSLRELGVFKTQFPVSNGNCEYPMFPAKSLNLGENETNHSTASSLTNRKRSLKSQISLPERISRQTVSQPAMPLNGTDKVLPAYESWPMHKTYAPAQPGALPQPCRMT